jgi:hypothetical protein
VSNVLVVVFFDQIPYKKIPDFDQNLHKNIFWRRSGQSSFGDTMKRKEMSSADGDAKCPVGMGYIFLFLGCYD